MVGRNAIEVVYPRGRGRKGCTTISRGTKSSSRAATTRFSHCFYGGDKPSTAVFFLYSCLCTLTRTYIVVLLVSTRCSAIPRVHKRSKRQLCARGCAVNAEKNDKRLCSTVQSTAIRRHAEARKRPYSLPEFTFPDIPVECVACPQTPMRSRGSTTTRLRHCASTAILLRH